MYDIATPIVAGDGNIEIVCLVKSDIVLLGASAQFVLYNSNKSLILSKSASVDETNKTLTVMITKAETAPLLGAYQYNFIITDTSANVLTLRENGSLGNVTFIERLPDA